MKIEIIPKIYKTILTYARLAPGEISGFGSVRSTNNQLIIDKVYLLEQVSTGADSTLEKSAVAKLLVRPDVKPENIKLWWHSHANMDVFWSGTDQAAIESFGEITDWFISIVVNKHGKYRLRLDIFKPERFVFDNLTLYTHIDVNIDTNELKDEIKQKVKSHGNIIPTQLKLTQPIYTIEFNRPNRPIVNNIQHNTTKEKYYIDQLYDLKPRFQHVCPECNIIVDKNELCCHNCGAIL